MEHLFVVFDVRWPVSKKHLFSANISIKYREEVAVEEQLLATSHLVTTMYKHKK